MGVQIGLNGRLQDSMQVLGYTFRQMPNGNSYFVNSQGDWVPFPVGYIQGPFMEREDGSRFGYSVLTEAGPERKTGAMHELHDLQAWAVKRQAALLKQPEDDTWQPIASAPKDGTVVLTDEGTARYMQKREGQFGGVPRDGWYLCTFCGDIPSCADNGLTVSHIEPKTWVRHQISNPVLAALHGVLSWLNGPEGPDTLFERGVRMKTAVENALSNYPAW